MKTLSAHIREKGYLKETFIKNTLNKSIQGFNQRLKEGKVYVWEVNAILKALELKYEDILEFAHFKKKSKPVAPKEENINPFKDI